MVFVTNEMYCGPTACEGTDIQRAAWLTFCGRLRRGKEYMAPSVKVQETPSQALKPSVMICARRRSESITELSSCFHCSYDSEPSLGGFTISAMPSCTAEWKGLVGPLLRERLKGGLLSAFNALQACA